jgi:aminoglycoside phosphotransferase (APT) family kinase protein
METQKLIEQLHVEKIVQTLVERAGVHVYQVRLRGKFYLLKCYEREVLFSREADALMRLADTYLPVPRIVSAGRSREGVYYFLQEWWDGVGFATVYAQMKTRKEQQQALFEVGHLLARLQVALTPRELEEAQFWRISLGQDVFADVDWRESKRRQFLKWKGRLRLTAEDVELGVPEAMQRLEQQLDRLPKPEQLTILHNDYGFRNLMYVRNHGFQIGVFDFENVSIGDPTYDLVKLSFNDLDPEDEEMQFYFAEGYRRHSPFSQQMSAFPLYQALEGFGCMSWVDKHPVIGAEEEQFRRKGRGIFLNRILHGKKPVGE